MKYQVNQNHSHTAANYALYWLAGSASAHCAGANTAADLHKREPRLCPKGLQTSEEVAGSSGGKQGSGTATHGGDASKPTEGKVMKNAFGVPGGLPSPAHECVNFSSSVAKIQGEKSQDIKQTTFLTAHQQPCHITLLPDVPGEEGDICAIPPA
ncbi:hypothetical protein Anapl_09466 [Anas platyrhynchos]|uniref:Uncharacterized protein n=1 Tax=Anas platyrhynchos TaxID=8839 RepID=R0LQ98_ANAPL|nr:hypothetical protein Anapl_09466 [Anas platyrhynchos]